MTASVLLHPRWIEPTVMFLYDNGGGLVADELNKNMEGAAAAHICRLYGVPFIEVRAISNQVEDRRREAWDIPLACRRAQAAAALLLQEMPTPRDPHIQTGGNG